MGNYVQDESGFKVWTSGLVTLVAHCAKIIQQSFGTWEKKYLEVVEDMGDSDGGYNL